MKTKHPALRRFTHSGVKAVQAVRTVSITLILATALLARADVLPPAQDSSSLNGKLTPVTGKATTLAISATRKGYVLFNLNSLPAEVQAANIANARLRVYFPAAKKPGDIAIHTVTSAWNETETRPAPGVSVSPVAMFPAVTVVAKKFVEVDVTTTVQAWLAGTTTNNGFALTASGLTNVLIGAKEGPGSGYPCALEIEIEPAFVGGVSAASVATAASLASAATNVNTGGTLVKRDASGNFSVGTVTATSFVGDGSGLTNIPAIAVAMAPQGMALIPAGSFTIGNSIGDTDITDADPISTTVSAFYMDVNEVTLSQWQSVYYWAKDNGYTDLSAGSGKGPNHPVQSVTWYDVVKWCNARSEQAGKTPVYYTNDVQTTIYKTGSVNVTNAQVKWTATGYRLPTEAEMEKAARGGRSGLRFPWGNTITQNLANYTGATASFTYDLGPNGNNAVGSVGGTSPATSPVGTFAANGYGLNDMSGNVIEWCWDWYGTPYAGGTDPHGATTGSLRVVRGGSWLAYAFFARCAFRDSDDPNNNSNRVGFRAVLPAGQP